MLVGLWGKVVSWLVWGGKFSFSSGGGGYCGKTLTLEWGLSRLELKSGFWKRSLQSLVWRLLVLEFFFSKKMW